MKSLQFLVNEQRIYLFAYVIMSNHIHLLWQKQATWQDKNIQLMFMKFTAQQIKFNIRDKQPDDLRNYISSQSDRHHQFWKRRPWRAQMPSRRIAEQKIDYIHNNPVKAKLCKVPEDYWYSSASFYETGRDEWGILSHYMDFI